MRKSYSLFFALLAGAASLASCSRSNYAFNNQGPAYLGSAKTAQLVTPAPVPNSAAAVSTEATAAPVALPMAATTRLAVAPSPKPVKPTLVQRILLKKLAKQLAKVQGAKHNVAEVAKPASEAGNAGLVILAGAIIILIGGLIGGANIVVTIGGVVFVVGLVLLIVALVRG